MNVGAPPKVRFNEEIAAFVTAPAPRKIEKGDPINFSELDRIESIQLTPHDPEAGHITMLRVGDHWAITCNFVYNRTLAKTLIEAGDEFLAAAASNATAKLPRSLVDNLLSACELFAKA